MKNTSQKTRVGFGGKIENFESREESNFEKKHLKAYLKGDMLFSFGKDNRNQPKMFKVLEITN